MGGSEQEGGPAGESSRHGLTELIAERRAKAQRLAASDPEAFPYAYPDVEPISTILDAYAHLADGEETEDRHRVAGRIAARRGAGRAAFLDLVDRSGKIQLHARVDVLCKEAFERLTSLDLGDLLGVDGACCAAAMESSRCGWTPSRSSPRRCVLRPTSITGSATWRRATADASWT